VLIIVPPSESKQAPADEGHPVVFDGLSFPGLTVTRRRIVDALVATSGEPDAFRRLGVGPSLADEVIRNTWLLDQPTRPVLDVYTGPLHEGLAAGSWSAAAAARAAASVVVTSAVWGALRPADHIPSYRCHICSHLVGMDRLEPTWRAVLPDVLRDAAGPRGLVLDLRSPTYQAAGMPEGLGRRTVTVRVRRFDADGRRIGDVVAKRTRGEAARRLLESGTDPVAPGELADALSDRWPVQLDPSSRDGGPWSMILTATTGRPHPPARTLASDIREQGTT